MKKTTKATIAAAAAGILLVTGAGTVALWQQSETVNAGTVDTGHLKLTVDDNGVWSDISDGGAGVPFNPDTDQIVPGDVVAYTQTVRIDAEGKNIQGALSVGTLQAIPEPLQDEITLGLDIDATADGLTKDGNVISFAEQGIYQVPVTITVTFPEGTTASTPDDTMDQPLDLNALTLTLDQVRS